MVHEHVATPKWERSSVTHKWESIARCDHGCCRSCIKGRKSEGMGKQVPGHHAPSGLRLAAFLTWLLQLRDGEGGPGRKRVREEKDKELGWGRLARQVW